MIDYEQEDINRFWSKITIIKEGENAGCWEVDYSKSNIYPIIYIKRIPIKCSRFMYQIYHQDEDIDGKVIMHSCDNKRCVCPDHLSSGAHADNSKDMVIKDRQAKGSRIGIAKLTEENIEEIINNTLSGYFTNCEEIAYHYNITYVSIRCLINEKTWVHITKNYDMVKIRDLLDNYKGCNNHQFVLSKDDVINIRQRLKSGEFQKDIAKIYNVHQVTISKIKLGKTHENI